MNADQPVFVLASTMISEQDASAILSHSFSRGGKEAKYAKLAKSRRGREELLAFFAALGLGRGHTSYWAVHKQFILFTHLIDFWMEPMAHDDGLNLYERGANIALSNLGFLTLGTCLGLDGRQEFLRQFQVMMRDRSPFAYRNFWDTFESAARKHDVIAGGIGALLAAPRRLGYRHLLQLPERILDLGDYGLITTISYWSGQHPNERFAIIHDECRMLRENREFWEQILDQSNPTAVVGQDRRTITFPLPVTELRLEDSKAFPQLQVADLVAGAARELLISTMTGRHDEYSEALQESGLSEIWNGAVWPTDQVTPEQLGTTGPALKDAASFIAELVRRHESPG